MTVSKPIKERMMEKTAADLGQPLELVEVTMAWVFKDIVKGVKTYTQMEVSGFGTLMISKAKVRNKIERLERILGYLKEKPLDEIVQKKIDGVEEELKYLYLKRQQTNETKQESI